MLRLLTFERENSRKVWHSVQFAIAMKLSERSLSLKLNGKVGWKDSEIWKAIQLLDIPVEKIHLYFFKEKVHVI